MKASHLYIFIYSKYYLGLGTGSSGQENDSSQCEQPGLLTRPFFFVATTPLAGKGAPPEARYDAIWLPYLFFLLTPLKPQFRFGGKLLEI